MVTQPVILVDDVRRLIKSAQTASVNELIKQNPTAAAAVVACIRNLENAIDLHLMEQAGDFGPADDGESP